MRCRISQFLVSEIGKGPCVPKSTSEVMSFPRTLAQEESTRSVELPASSDSLVPMSTNERSLIVRRDGYRAQSD